jgi:hypothetical protein
MPDKYFVAECITTSAPKSSGFANKGSKVLSTASIISLAVVILQ